MRFSQRWWLFAILLSAACHGSSDAPANTEAGNGGTKSGSGGASAASGGAANTSGGAANTGGADNAGVGGASGASGGGGDMSAGTGGSTGGPGGGPSVGGGAQCKGINAAVTSSTAASAKVAITIDASATGCVVASDFSGTNYESFAGWGADVSMSAFQKRAFQSAGTQLFRYPGGAPGDWFDYTMTGKCSDNTTANWGAPTYNTLWAFAKDAGVSSLMLQTNPTSQFCGSGAHDSSGAHVTAIAKDVAAQGIRVVYEIGNEPDIADSFFAKNGGESAYTNKFIEHANAIHAASPGAEVYGPVVCGLGANCSFPTTWDSGWIDKFLAQTGNKASGAGKGTVDGISFHVYWHPEWSYSDLAETKSDKYGFALYWSQKVMPYVRSLIAKYDTRDLPIAISEISVGNGVSGDTAQKQNVFSVLETLDVIGAFAVSGLRSFQWFDANAQGPSDYWMITNKDPKPIFYSFVAWSKMGNQVLDVSSSVNPHDVAAYATKKSDGSVQVLLINKTSSSHEVAMTFNGFAASGKPMQVHAIKSANGSDTGSSIVYNGATDPQVDALPQAMSVANTAATPSYTLPAYSLAVLSFGP